MLASFRGVASHPCREALRQLHDGANIIVELVPRENHAGRLDAVTGSGDAAYAGLLARSLFAFVPRGDALFSYRLLEALSFGCIPIVISDGWVLPFDRLIPWKDAALVVAENAVAEIPEMLGRIPKAQAEEMRANARGIYESRLANLDLILESLLMEAGMLLGAGS